ncbi:DUF6356 family protein [Sphingobium boeckii]|uniref:DUF6356 family protein n=1 Tax=Sphingobium boeckii TaxID=1082345 RepID=UPI001C8495C1|nr:DUF6356 family protein [Sphingobium boeckii]
MIKRWFLSHPLAVGETYLAHQRTALTFAGQLFVAAMACAIHAIFPSLFTRTGSQAVQRIHDNMQRRHD